MTKKYSKGINCSYCGDYTTNSTRSHIIGSCFYDTTKVINPLPTIKSCFPCNNNRSNAEDYTSIILTIASGKKLNAKQERGFQHFNKKRRELFKDAKESYGVLNGIYQKVAIPKIDHSALESTFEHIAMGIAYHYTSNLYDDVPINKRYSGKKIIAALDTSSEQNITETLLKLRINPLMEIADTDAGRYNNDINYVIIATKDKAIVYISIYKSTLFKTNGQQSRIIGVTFSK
jgi:hypothetical protein